MWITMLYYPSYHFPESFKSQRSSLLTRVICMPLWLLTQIASRFRLFLKVPLTCCFCGQQEENAGPIWNFSGRSALILEPESSQDNTDLGCFGFSSLYANWLWNWSTLLFYSHSVPQNKTRWVHFLLPYTNSDFASSSSSILLSHIQNWNEEAKRRRGIERRYIAGMQ